MQHRAKTPVRGRHRRTVPLHSHRTLSALFGERGRYAMVTAALVGVGVAGASAATAAPSQSAATRQAAAQSPVVPAPTVQQATTTTARPSRALSAAAAPGRRATAPSAKASAAALAEPPPAYARVQRKARPVPTPAPVRKAAPQWVNPMPEGVVTSCFGQRWGRLHAGVDMAAQHGTPIRAAGAGTVVSAGAAAGYGNAVLIQHRNGHLTHYGHMATITVQVGQQVDAGDQIGNEGSTGHSTGPHLHFEVHKGTYKNPIEPTGWMQALGVDIAGCTAVRD